MTSKISGPCAAGCLCDACRGIEDETPALIDNRPGLPTIRYRAGDHYQFKQSLLAGVARAEHVALRRLTTRRDDDFSIALLDAFAVMADVLTFYQERIANESYLRTAKETVSIGYIARLIGYELGPGAAAATMLAFNMVEGVGQVEKLRLATGVQVQSTPGPDEKPQLFETVEEIEARPAWNDLTVATTRPQVIGATTSVVTLKGAAANVRPGDTVLLVYPIASGGVRAEGRRVLSAVAEPQGRSTELRLGGQLGSTDFASADPDQVGVFVLRRQASPFGHNAPDFVTINKSRPAPESATDWPLATFSTSASKIDLDSTYPEVVPGSWAVWTRVGDTPTVLRVTDVVERARAAYMLSARVTQITVAPGLGDSLPAPASFSQLRDTTLRVQSEKMELAKVPVDHPVGGASLRLSNRSEGIEPGQLIAVQGNRLVAEVLKPTAVSLTLQGSPTAPVEAGTILDLLAFPTPLGNGTSRYDIRWNGLFGVLDGGPDVVTYRSNIPAAEVVEVTAVTELGALIQVTPALEYVYDPPSVVLNANVSRATHGETVKEVFEGGQAAIPHQRFILKQTPLTYVASGSSPGGVRSTLRVWVDDVEWHEAPYLYGRGPKDRVFVVRRDGEGRTWIQFGDGLAGARLPTGQRNVRAQYRRGIGTPGLLDQGRLNMLLTRPQGLKDAINPVPSLDAEDPEALEDARRNAPVTVLTLDRVVSLRDYEDFSRVFGGIYKAQATWSWFQAQRGVLVTVAGFQGGEVSVEGCQTLRSSLADWGDPHVPVTVINHDPVTFRTGLRVKVAADREAPTVLKAVAAALRAAFSFDARRFGQAVSLGEVTAAAQGALGVEAVNVVALYRTGDADPQAGLTSVLRARAPMPGSRDETLPAELLTLDSAPLDLLEEMS